MEVRQYTTKDGKSPFAEWLRGFRDRRTKSRILVRLNRVRLGNLGDAKSVGEGVYELRIAFGPGYRIYFGREGQSRILVLCGGDKSTQSEDVGRAKDYWADYRSKHSGEE